MHAPEIHAEIRRLIALEVNDCEIARRLGIGRSTVRDIRVERYRKRDPAAICPRCWRAMKPVDFTEERYAYLLGMYLGDGCIQLQPNRRHFSLRISCDVKYPDVIEEVRSSLVQAFPLNAVSEHDAGPRASVTVLCVYGQHLPCLFPQHGPGKKHERPIRLEDWQMEIVTRAPWLLIRGLLQSDGCRFVNRTGKYEYPSYDFTQVSHDIKDILRMAYDQVGVRYRAYSRRVRVYDRASVALLDEHVGPKS